MNRTNAGRHHDSGQNLPKLPAAKARERFLAAGRGRLQAIDRKPAGRAALHSQIQTTAKGDVIVKAASSA